MWSVANSGYGRSITRSMEKTDMEALKHLRVCSLHFKPEDFERNVLGMKRDALLKTAIPSKFTILDDDEQPGTSGTSGAKRICLESPCPSTPGLSDGALEVGDTDESYRLESTLTRTSSSSSSEDERRMTRRSL
ncbi:hypothetical protein N1851_025783 [Merluccius polli]|uniref:THAP-type domain-containing protein n=1 Tax=Merluccius polli TaxID=89951 RepID=A0AA47NUM5_MERPO|nr:hypothetical protein N1851_025783 [Merluccius polli]